MNQESKLTQYCVSSGETFTECNLGTRPPLKHVSIKDQVAIDMVCDQTSGRIYTLSCNWTLEVWNLEHSQSLPLKRVTVCSYDGKDYISLYYKNTFGEARPRFLSLEEHNKQVLVVNTSCVNGGLVFIDPISFAVLKRFQLRYCDYETPQNVR